MKKTNNSNKDDLKNELWGIIFIALGLFIVFCLWQGTGQNDITRTGAVGSFIFRALKTFFGAGKWLIPLLVIVPGIIRLRAGRGWDKFTVISWLTLFICILAILHLRLPAENQNFAAGWIGLGGGITGALVALFSLTLFGKVGSYIFVGACIGISIIGIAKKTFSEIFTQIREYLSNFLLQTRHELADLIFDKSAHKKGHSSDERIKHAAKPEATMPIRPLIIDHTDNVGTELHSTLDSPVMVKSHLKLVKDNTGSGPAKKAEDLTGFIRPKISDYKLPDLNLLQFPPRVKSQRLNRDITDNVRILEETLENFGVKARVTQVSRGPSITRYEIQPPPGIKVSRIVNLADDIALSLAATQVRIEAPIPGKAAVGVEVPNEEISVVTLREVLENSLFQESSSKLTIALGKDIAGNPIVADLGKMPHLLIAGATGSGKSVCMNAIISSILFKATPDEVKLLMIDPKVVELSNFNGIPHLIAPVVTDAKKAATSLRWAVGEMETRYELFAGLGVKDIQRYNEAKKAEDPSVNYPFLPYIVVLIDELADLMMVAPADVEDAICRLAQMARAAGIHLVVATQRPSVDVITGIIKANIPSRIAFAVSSQTDSRTILDMGGAERLLGRGDMLFYPTGMAKPLRVQGVFVSDHEIDELVEYLKEQKSPEYLTPWQDTEQEIQESDHDDELLPEAARLFIESGQASISLLQRRLRIGYTRAARIIDQLEQKGIVGGYEGSKPRVIRMTLEEYEKTFGYN